MIGTFIIGLGVGGLVASLACLLILRAANFFASRQRIPRSIVRRHRRFAALNTQLQRELMVNVLSPQPARRSRGRR